MAKVHIVLQGKGGVGKSFVSAIIAQYLLSKKQNPLCIDTDPINATFAGYKKLKVHKLDLMENEEINSRKFDELVEMIAAADDDIIIDNGASSFIPLSSYLISNQIPQLLEDLGHELILHTVITGGQAQLDTVSGFAQLAKQFPADNTTFIVWLNPYWGSITADGKGFEQFKAFTENKAKVAAVLKIPELKEETFGYDLSDILKQRITFDEAIDMPEKPIVVRQRLKIIKSKLFDEIELKAAI